MRYGDGPTNRVAAPRSIAPTTAPKADAPSAPRSTTPTRRPEIGKGRSGAKTSEPGKIDKSAAKGSSWRDVRRSDPKSARDVQVGTKLAGRGLEVGKGVATGAIGGVTPSPYRGGGSGGGSSDWVCDPWGWSSYNSCGYYWGYSCGWSWWWYPFYWAWYYPAWWSCSYPYYYSDYCYYRPVTTVVYTDPEVIYVERESVGEAVVPEQPAEPAGKIAPPAESPLSIAAQRYLELGDRAFREGRYTDSVQFYAKAVEFAPDQGALYLVLSDALFAAGDYHYGAYAVRRALELDPSLVDSQIDKHEFYPDPAQFDAQLAALERYLDDHPTDRDARLVLALNYLFSARPRDAVRTIDSAVGGMADDQAAQKIAARARAAAGG